MPRHPPYALKNLNTQNDQNKSQINEQHHHGGQNHHDGITRSPEMLASTVQFSKNNRAHQPPHPRSEDGASGPAIRGHRAKARFLRTQQRAHQTPARNPPFPLPTGPRSRRRYLPGRASGLMNSQCSTSMSSHLTDIRRQRQPPTTTPRPSPCRESEAALASCVLLRKEVIQPHLPVRLPCYDFVPIAGPTFDRSPHTRWLGHGLRVLPTFVT